MELSPYLPLQEIQKLLTALKHKTDYKFEFDYIEYSYSSEHDCVETFSGLNSSSCNHNIVKNTPSLEQALTGYIKIRQNGPQIK